MIIRASYGRERGNSGEANKVIALRGVARSVMTKGCRYHRFDLPRTAERGWDALYLLIA